MSDFSVLPSVGDRVVVHGKHTGTVRYVGSVDYANGDDWCGVEMDEPGIGKNNGTVKGKTYFTTPNKMVSCCCCCCCCCLKILESLLCSILFHPCVTVPFLTT